MGSGDPMLHNKVRLTALAGCAVGVLVVAGCGAREPVEAPPASAAPGYAATQTPELMGAAPGETTPADGLLGGPAASTLPVAAPVPVSSHPGLKTWRRADGTLVTAMAPIANPKHRVVHYKPRAVAHHAAIAAPRPVGKSAPAPVAHPVIKPAARPVAVAPAPAPVRPVAAVKPVAAVAKAPTPTPTPAIVAPVKAAPPKVLTKLQKLQAAVAPEATKGAVLASGESLAQGKEGQVTLSLPATLGDMIKKEAAKLGLTKAAKKTSAYADLQGEGYQITPNGRQTAVVKPGEAPTFAWQVKPTDKATGALKTEFGVELNGTKPAQGFSLGSIAKQVAPMREKVQEATKGFKFALPSLGGFETIDVPGLGKVQGKSVLGGALVLLALLILVAIARNASASRTRAERQRKFRTLTDYGRNEMEFGAPPQSASVNYVNPMVAAAGGALAGAAVATAVNHHGHDDHARDDHGHDSPEHDAHAGDPARDDHGHGTHAEPDHHDHPHDGHHVVAPAGEAVPVSGHDQAEVHPVEHAGDHDAHADHGQHVEGHETHKELEPAH